MIDVREIRRVLVDVGVEFVRADQLAQALARGERPYRRLEPADTNPGWEW